MQLVGIQSNLQDRRRRADLDLLVADDGLRLK